MQNASSSTIFVGQQCPRRECSESPTTTRQSRSPIEDKKGLTANRRKSLLINAGGGTRTHTPSYGYWILNPARLPIPPLRPAFGDAWNVQPSDSVRQLMRKGSAARHRNPKTTAPTISGILSRFGGRTAGGGVRSLVASVLARNGASVGPHRQQAKDVPIGDFADLAHRAVRQRKDHRLVVLAAETEEP
jgi:hypothetical protein